MTAIALPAASMPGGRGLPNLTLTLAATSVAAMVALTVVTVVGAPTAIRVLAQLVLVAAFVALTFVDFRAAVAIALVELAVGGAGGAWTRFPGGWSGRHVLDAIVMVGAIAILYRDWRMTRTIELGRYGPHALVLAAVIPLVWMSLGLLNGHAPRNVFADGNGHLFFAFTVVFVVLIKHGFSGWLRGSLLAACAANALVTLALIMVSAPGLLPLHAVLAPVLLEDLEMGGAVGYMSNGAFRLYLGSGIYLQVGLALTAWHLLDDPRRWWAWTLYAVLMVDVIATYTRGFWVGGAIAVGIVLVVAARDWRQAAAFIGGTLVILVALTTAGGAIGFSLPNYVLARSATILDQPEATSEATAEGTRRPASTAPAGTIEGGGAGTDEGGQFSNTVRATQARVLLGHIVERPLLGHGFGAIAEDYPYAKIFSYELAFLDLAYKTGIVGTLLYLSYPVRLAVDAARGRYRELRIAPGVPRRELAVVIAIIVSVLAVGSTNPYILAAFGLLPILACIAWLEPADA